MSKVTFPIWMNRGELHKLEIALSNVWTKIDKWMQLSLTANDIRNCDIDLVNLRAYERSVERFTDEPESLFRERVLWARQNSEDAGSTVGLERIFNRLGVTVINITERDENSEWDIIIIELEDGELSQNQALINALIRQYGRTCRRYAFQLTTIDSIRIQFGTMSGDYQTFAAKMENENGASNYISL